MIFQRHVTDHLAPFLDETLNDALCARVEAHLAGCAKCRNHLDQVRTAKTILQQIPLSEAPESLWSAIEAAANARSKEQTRAQLPMWRFVMAALLVVAVFAGYWSYSRQSTVQWEVAASDGSTRAVAAGNWIETGPGSRARIRVGAIGSVEVEPNTRVRLGASGSAGHRLELGGGAISAKISAPPRLFFVDTPAATAVDLGCEYRIQCDRSGTGILNVSQGWVALEWRGADSLVPAGASCRMLSGRGPGTPWFDDAPKELVDALERFDFQPASVPKDLDVILSRARSRDTLTLWHLLTRVEAPARSRVYERMVEFAPPPADLKRNDLMRLNRQSLLRWKDELAWTW